MKEMLVSKKKRKLSTYQITRVRKVHSGYQGVPVPSGGEPEPNFELALGMPDGTVRYFFASIIWSRTVPDVFANPSCLWVDGIAERCTGRFSWPWPMNGDKGALLNLLCDLTVDLSADTGYQLPPRPRTQGELSPKDKEYVWGISRGVAGGHKGDAK